MNPLDFLLAMNDINAAAVDEAIELMHGGTVGNDTREVINLNKHRRKTLRRSALIAAIVALLAALGAAAYATDLFGLRAMAMDPTDNPVYEFAEQTDGSVQRTVNPEARRISLTQPQEVPDYMPEEVKRAVENSRLAWAEWEEYRASLPDTTPAFMLNLPDGLAAIDTDYSDDGTCTITLYGYVDGELAPIETHSAPSEEVKAWEDHLLLAAQGFGKYDYFYFARDAAGEVKLEEIAAKYGLALRGRSTQLGSSDTMKAFAEEFGREYTPLDMDIPNKELTQFISDNFCTGDFFREPPSGYDKVYYYDEGTFAVSFYFDGVTASDRTNDVYLYNSPYTTLSSGMEMYEIADAPDELYAREHTAPDGTVITVLADGNEIYAYAFLEKSYVTMRLYLPDGASDEDIDAALDRVNYSVINK